MGKFAISFRIDTATHVHTYAERYTSFMDQVRKTGSWEETTSFALVTSGETAEQLADRLYYHSHFDATYDLMLVVDIEAGAGVTRGPLAYPATLSGKLNQLLQK